MTTEQKLLPCPFCGNETPSFERMGSHRQSCIVECGNCGCRHESSDEDEKSGTSWNYRPAVLADRGAGAAMPTTEQKLREALASILECCDEPYESRDYLSRQVEIRGIALYALSTPPAEPAGEKVAELVEALEFYAEESHFTKHDPDAWDTVSGEPQNFWEDDANTATVEDGSIARAALAKYKGVKT